MKKSIKLLSVIMALVMLVSAVSVFAFTPDLGYVEVTEDETLKNLSNADYIIFNGDYDKKVYVSTALIPTYNQDGGYYIMPYKTNKYVQITNGTIALVSDKANASVFYCVDGYVYTDVTETKTVTTLSGFFSLFSRFVPSNYVSTTRYYVIYDETATQTYNLNVSVLPTQRVTFLREVTKETLAEDIASLYYECKVYVDVQKTASLSSFMSWFFSGAKGNVESDRYTMTITVDMDRTVAYDVSYCVLSDTQSSQLLGSAELYKADPDKWNYSMAQMMSFSSYYGIATFSYSGIYSMPNILVKVSYVDESGSHTALQICAYSNDYDSYITMSLEDFMNKLIKY